MLNAWCGSVAIHLLGLWFGIQLGVWMSVLCECCVMSGTGLCFGLIPHAEESYCMWCVRVCSWSLDNKESLAHYRLLQPEGGRGLMLIMLLVMHSVNICGRELVNFSAVTGQRHIAITWGKTSFVVIEYTRHWNKCLNSNPYAQHDVFDITWWLHHSIRSVCVCECVRVCGHVRICVSLIVDILSLFYPM